MNRTIEQLVGKMWLPVEMEDLKVDNVFRMFEPNGDPVNLGQVWIVTEKPYIHNGIWGVSCEPIEGVIVV